MPRLTVAAAAAVLSVAGCGGGNDRASSTGDGSRGAKVFAEAGCGNCHTLADADTKGAVGPNLDAAKYDQKRVVDQVTRGGGGMPGFDKRLTSRQILAVADYVARVSGTRVAAPAKAFTPDDTTLSECDPGDSDCFRRALGNLAYEKGPKVALARFDATIRSDQAVEAACHPIAHTIGAAALLKFKGNVGRAFAEGNAICSSGYYHGLLERKLARASGDELAAAARSVCTSVGETSGTFIRYQCTHGLGHGLMLQTHNELPRALGICHRLATSFDQVSCSGGVFMENLQPSYGVRSRWLHDDDLLYPCNADIVGKQDKLYCYLMVSSRILPGVGRDWTKVAQWCRRSDRAFIRICFQGVGREAAGHSRQSPAGIRRLCARVGSDAESECLFGAVRDMMNNDPDDPRARQLCEGVAARHRQYCFYGLGSILGAVHASRGAREAACRRLVSAADRADCVRGAVVAPKPTRAARK